MQTNDWAILLYRIDLKLSKCGREIGDGTVAIRPCLKTNVAGSQQLHDFNHLGHPATPKRYSCWRSRYEDRQSNRVHDSKCVFPLVSCHNPARSSCLIQLSKHPNTVVHVMHTAIKTCLSMKLHQQICTSCDMSIHVHILPHVHTCPYSFFGEQA